jgi:hypothetical protein
MPTGTQATNSYNEGRLPLSSRLSLPRRDGTLGDHASQIPEHAKYIPYCRERIVRRRTGTTDCMGTTKYHMADIPVLQHRRHLTILQFDHNDLVPTRHKDGQPGGICGDGIQQHRAHAQPNHMGGDSCAIQAASCGHDGWKTQRPLGLDLLASSENTAASIQGSSQFWPLLRHPECLVVVSFCYNPFTKE